MSHEKVFIEVPAVDLNNLVTALGNIFYQRNLIANVVYVIHITNEFNELPAKNIAELFLNETKFNPFVNDYCIWKEDSQHGGICAHVNLEEMIRNIAQTIINGRSGNYRSFSQRGDRTNFSIKIN